MIILGSAGSEGLGNEAGFKKAISIGCKAYEVEFTHGVNMSIAEAKRLGEIAKELKLNLSIHAPYFINLVSKENKKISASKKRILDSCERAHYLGAGLVIFHAGYYQDMDKEKVYLMIKEEIIDMLKTIKENRWNVNLAPEATGKKSQFGTVEELLKLSRETGCSFCIDFAHILARNGEINYIELLKTLPKKIQAHFSGIEYTESGERRHIPVDINEFKKLAEEIKKQNKDVTIINESPLIFADLEKMMKVLRLNY